MERDRNPQMPHERTPAAKGQAPPGESLTTGAAKREGCAELPTPGPALHVSPNKEDTIARELFGMVPTYVGASCNSNGVAFIASDDVTSLQSEMIRLMELGHQGALLGRPKPGFFTTLAEQRDGNPNLHEEDEPLSLFEDLVEPLSEPSIPISGMVFEGTEWELWRAGRAEVFGPNTDHGAPGRSSAPPSDRIIVTEIQPYEVDPERFDPPINAAIDLTNGRLGVSLEGYGLKGWEPGAKGGNVVEFDYFQGDLRLLVWSDINQEDATYCISLKNALESSRKEADR